MHSITGKMNKDATQFQAGESTGFGIRLGVKYRDPKTKVDAWTNYSAAIFAKSPGQIQFYQSVLIEGAIVSIGAEHLKIDSFDGQNGQILSIEMLNARLTYAHNPNSQQAPQQQGGYGQQAAPQRPPAQPAYSQAPPQQARQPQSPNGHQASIGGGNQSGFQPADPDSFDDDHPW